MIVDFITTDLLVCGSATASPEPARRVTRDYLQAGVGLSIMSRAIPCLETGFCTRNSFGGAAAESVADGARRAFMVTGDDLSGEPVRGELPGHELANSDPI